MSARGLDFVENWILKNVTPAHHAGGHKRATTLAEQCMAEAASQGIPIVEKIPGRLSITGTILDAMLHLAEPGTPGD
jgi:hypothetical protein